MTRQVLALLAFGSLAGIVSAATIVEGFEGLSAGANIPAWAGGGGFLVPGTVGTYTFASGVQLVAPIPNSNIGQNGEGDVLIGDSRLGSASWGLGSNGSITTGAFGTAYLGWNSSTDASFFTLRVPSAASMVGAFVEPCGGCGNGLVTMSVFNSSMTLLGSTTLGSGTWNTNFISLSIPNISFIRFSGEFLVLDNFTFSNSTATPEPSTWMLTAAGAGLVLIRRLRVRR